MVPGSRLELEQPLHARNGRDGVVLDAQGAEAPCDGREAGEGRDAVRSEGEAGEARAAGEAGDGAAGRASVTRVGGVDETGRARCVSVGYRQLEDRDSGRRQQCRWDWQRSTSARDFVVTQGQILKAAVVAGNVARAGGLSERAGVKNCRASRCLLIAEFESE